MKDFLIHTTTKSEENFIAEFLDRMNVSYESRFVSEFKRQGFEYSDELKAQLDQVEDDVINNRTDKFISEDELNHRISELLEK
jgi:hypothetical protein